MSQVGKKFDRRDLIILTWTAFAVTRQRTEGPEAAVGSGPYMPKVYGLPADECAPRSELVVLLSPCGAEDEGH
jgi:hypothetical protein